MQQARYLLRPVNVYFVALSLFLALLFGLIPWGEPNWAPDMVALTLMFWNIHQPRKVGVGIAFFMGLLIDAQNATFLGEHAIAYSLMSYFAMTIHRRELWLTAIGRAVHVILLLLLVKLTLLLLGLIMTGNYPDFSYLIPLLIESLLWPIISWLLLMPQQRPEDVDTTRPL